MKQAAVFLAALSCLCSCAGRKVEQGSNFDYHVCAYVWPSCHDDSLGRTNWEEGIGEWEVIRQGNPRFAGHYQPKQPLWGYEMDNDPEVVAKWIDTALGHGVNTFIYDWYWFDSYPYLESALNDGFLKAPGHEKMDFYIMWANHDVKHNYWNYHKWKDDDSILWPGAVDYDNFKIIVDRVIRQYFHEPNYVKIDGCPVFAIFSMQNLAAGLGGMEQAGKAMAYFRAKVREAGFPDLHLQMIDGGGPSCKPFRVELYKGWIDTLGINSYAFYNMGGFDVDYLKHGEKAVRIREDWKAALDIPVFPCVSIAWDDTPRFPGKGAEDVTMYHNTPRAFASFLAEAKAFADAHADTQPKFIMINAWNEWVEGSYLLPDRLNGYGYLDAVKEVMEGE